MDKKLAKTIKYITAFLIPFTIIFTTYYLHGIFWDSDTSPLLGDGFHQYVIFDIELSNILHGKGSLFYTFTSGLGLNFYALSSYYLGSFLSPIVYFFNTISMPNEVYLTTMIKFGLAGLTSFISLKSIYNRVNHYLLLILSTSYTLMSFTVSQMEIKTWLDVFIIIPIVLLGLEKLIKKRKITIYFFSLTVLFALNYYFGFMTALFLLPWFFLRVSYGNHFIKSLFLFLSTSLAATLTSSIVLLPTLLDLRSHGETFTKVNQIFNPDAWYLDIFAKMLVGSFDTTKYGSIPMIYVGIFPLILCISLFFIKSIKFHVKLGYFLILALIIASFYITPMDLFWQGMHAPNMFLHRYSWTLSVVIIHMAAETLSHLEELKFYTLLCPILLLSGGFISVFLFKNHYSFLNYTNFILSFEFILAYLLLSWIVTKNVINKKAILTIALLFSVFEVALNSYFQMEGIATEWVFASKTSYTNNLKDIEKLVNFTEKDSKQFARTEQIVIKTGNDSMKYHYNGISQFSSVRNTNTSSMLDKLGFQSSGTNLNLRYQNNTILMDSLFNITYNISGNSPQKFGFTKIKEGDNLSLYKNRHALPMAFLSDGPYKDIAFTNLTLDNQRNFLNNLTNLNQKYFYKVSPFYESIIEDKNRVRIKDKEKATYKVRVENFGQVYMNVSNLEFDDEDNHDVDISVNGVANRFTTNNTFPFFNLGYHNKGEILEVSLTFPENKKVSFKKPEFFNLHIEEYLNAINKLKSSKTDVQTDSNKVFIDYDAPKNQSLIVTLPYDGGWTATQDGKNIPISPVQKGIMKIDVKKGKGRIVFQFIPQGFKQGALLAISGIALYLGILYLTHKKWE